LTRHTHQERKLSIKYYVGLDVSVKETSVCVVGETGRICREMKAPSRPDDLAQVLQDPAWRFERIGLEAGPLSQLLSIVRDDGVCRRLMTIPGVGPVVALAYTSTIDVPARFRNSKAVGASLGLTPVLHQSGESNRIGRVSLCGDGKMRTLLYEAAQVLLTNVHVKWSWLKAWVMNVAKRRGGRKAIVALARRLSVIMHRIWSDDTVFRWTRESVPAAV
jgi:hypothetical protein